MHGFLVFAVLALCSLVAGQYAGNKVIRVTPQDEREVDLLLELRNRKTIKVDFWAVPSSPKVPVDLHIDKHSYGHLAKHLTSKGMHFTIQIDDVQKLVDQQKRSAAGRSGGSWYSKYHPLDEIYHEMKSLYNRYYRNGNTRVFTVGRSYQNREQKAIEIKGKRKRNKPVFFINCGIHSREWVAPATCMYIAKQLLSRYQKDADVKAVLDKMDFVIMPVLNPDGYVHSWERERFWRKTRSQNGRGKPWCIGTDANRNWDFKWGLAGGSSDNPCDEDYRGPRPFSEVEIVNVANYLKKLGSRVKGYMDIHAFGQLWMIPWGYKTEHTTDHEHLMKASKAGVDAIRNAGYQTAYRWGPSSEVIYPNSGASKDYTYGALGIKYSFALELRDKGTYGFLLPKKFIIPTALETFKGILAAAKEMKI